MPEGFDQVMLPLVPRARALAARLLTGGGLSEDAVQEALIRALRFWDTRREAEAWPWLRRTVVHECLRLARSEAARRRREAAESGPAGPADLSPEEGLLLAEERAEVRRALERLPGGYRTVLQLRHGRGRTEAEVAAILGLPLGTVKWRCKRAHDHLRQVLAGRSPSPLSETLREVAILMEVRVTAGPVPPPASPVISETRFGRARTDWAGLAAALPGWRLPPEVLARHPDLEPCLLQEAEPDGTLSGTVLGGELATPHDRLIIDHNPSRGEPAGQQNHHLLGGHPLLVNEATAVGGWPGRFAQTGLVRHLFWTNPAGNYHVAGTLPATELRAIAEAVAAAAGAPQA